jgi:DNA repair photolyase
MKDVKTALTRQSGGYLNTFTHSLQPYSGCAFGQETALGQGCPYCYVRRLPVALFKGEPWGSWVEAKRNVADVLHGELRRVARQGNLSELRIFMSSATDPYQGVEAHLQLTRSCLEKFVEYPPGLLVVQTRSPMVVRDKDLLRQLRDHVWVSMTIETDDEDVRKTFTPTSPTVESRLKAMRELHEAGIRVQAAVSPMLPNHPEHFAKLLRSCCSRALVDTLLHGDGAQGRRSEALGMRERFERAGYAKWYDPRAHEPLLDALRHEFGAENVAFSQEGFNGV